MSNKDIVDTVGEDMKFIFFFSLFFLIFSQGYCATDGSLGTSSTGTSTITLTKLDLVRIMGIANASFSNEVSITAPTGILDGACVYSTTGSYNIRFTSTNASGTTFRMRSAASNYIHYDVQWNNADSGTTGYTMGSGVTSSTYSGAHTSSTTCAGANNSRMFIYVDATTFNNAPIGSYSDTLTVLVNPV